jgi:zeta-carotene desaturase
MPDVIVAGGGLAGMAAAAALAGAGCRVRLFERRGFLGGRASSYPVSPAEADSPTIDNCQHILLGCCVNLLDFYRRLGVLDKIRFYREFHFLEPGGRASVLRAARLPAPLHMAGSFARLRFLSWRDKAAIARALASVQRDSAQREDLDRITMLEWLSEKNQPASAIQRFWRPVLISAVNAELDAMAARYGLQVFRLAFFGDPAGFEMGVPVVPLAELYTSMPPGVEVRLRTTVERFRFEAGSVAGVEAGGELHRADFYVCALPFEHTGAVAPELGLDLTAFGHSPITSIHLWFDRAVTELPHAALLDRTIQWLFNKEGGRHVQLVVSASQALVEMSREQIIALALREMGEFFPAARHAVVVRAHVVKEVRATFSPAPGIEAHRPPARTAYRNFLLAGDWTKTGWPSTMEGAVRSGYLAAEAVTGQRFLLR